MLSQSFIARALLAAVALTACTAAQAEPPDPDHPSSTPAPTVAPVVGCNPDGCIVAPPEGTVVDGWRFSASSAPGTGSYGWWAHWSEQPTGTYFVAALCNGQAMAEGREFTDAECGPASAVYRVPEAPPPASVPELIDAYFGADAGTARRVAWCESSYREDAVNGRHRGIYQISSVHQDRIARLGFTWDDMLEAEPNIVVARDLQREQGWRPWACF